jgi:hypothetical protein
VWADLVQHLAEDLDTLIVDILKQRFYARLNDCLLNLILNEQLNEQAHVAEQLQLLPVLDLICVIYEQHLLVEIFLHLLPLHGHLHTLPAAPAFLLLVRLQLLELLLALAQQELLEVHLHVLLLIVLAE